MSLHIYRNRKYVPEGIPIVECNDSYFGVYSVIPDTALVQKELATIEQAKYLSPDNFYSLREEGQVPKDSLSTGTKTFLNVLQHPDKCFNICECDMDIASFLLEIQEGYILAEMNLLKSRKDSDDTCDIYVDNRHFTSKADVVYYNEKGFLDSDF